ncbi:Hypothetical predicted protein [Olea europaea subsp. europaea]|uniref:Uncharacterized protein n=1 Tax=Olea europaea subsp. europaea TaxID=158383 RepID=A0A8S0UZQ1_OLEEU|nr:Hypothetical predicted protein [Olea europaea subsp. europaea]
MSSIWSLGFYELRYHILFVNFNLRKSLAEILSKVAREPGLIELETEEDERNKNNEEYNFSTSENSDEDTHDEATEEFDIVDTMLVDDSEINNTILDSDEDTHDEATEEFDIVDTMLVDDSETNNTILGNTKSNVEMIPGRKDCGTTWHGNDISVSNLKNIKD